MTVTVTRTVPRTAMRALGLSPIRFLRSTWPWRSMAYLISGVVFGLLSGCVYLALAIGGAVTAILLVGLLAFPIMVLLSIYVARFERWRLRLVDPGPTTDPHPRLPLRTWRQRWRWITTRLREPATWREFGYTMVSFVALWWIDLVVIWVTLYIPGVLIFAQKTMPTESPFVDFWLMVLGLLLLPVAAYPLTAWAAARAAMTRAILLPLDEKLGEAVRSRARLVDSFEVERKRIERDLHDGAQQRLVALSLKLGLARLDLAPDSVAAVHVAEAHELAKEALDELRELIRGVHPQVLTDRGLPAAVDDLAGRAPVPVDTDLNLPGRLPGPVELAAYFVVAEALTNVARHSGAKRAAVRARLADSRLVLEVSDDGRGGADPDAGTGLAGLMDRVAAVDGVLVLLSPTGGPTLIRAELPCA